MFGVWKEAGEPRERTCKLCTEMEPTTLLLTTAPRCRPCFLQYFHLSSGSLKLSIHLLLLPPPLSNFRRIVTHQPKSLPSPRFTRKLTHTSWGEVQPRGVSRPSEPHSSSWKVWETLRLRLRQPDSERVKRTLATSSAWMAACVFALTLRSHSSAGQRGGRAGARLSPSSVSSAPRRDTKKPRPGAFRANSASHCSATNACNWVSARSRCGEAKLLKNEPDDLFPRLISHDLLTRSVCEITCYKMYFLESIKVKR